MKRLFSVVLFLLTSCASVGPAAPRGSVHVVIVGTTDVHGWFDGHKDAPPTGGPPVQYGGLPLFAAYVSALREANQGKVLVVDSGDLFQGTLESNLFEGEPVVLAYNRIGYTAAAVGNHEFDFGPVGPDVIATKPGQDPLGALKKNVSMMRFPMLSANLIERSTGRSPAWVQPSILVEVGGVRVGIIGLSTPTTPEVTMPANVAALEFTDPVAATIQNANDLRERGADAVVVIAHMGGRCTEMTDVHDASSCLNDQEAMQLLRRLPPGLIDAYFGGHTHSQMRHYVNGVAAVQALPLSTAFSTIDLWIDPSAHQVKRLGIRSHTMICRQVFEGTDSCEPRLEGSTKRLVPRVFEGKEIAPDQQVAAILAPFLRQVAAKRAEPVGVRTGAIFTRSYMRESALGDLLADSLREETGADIAFMNSGAIRANLRAGDLTYGDVFETSPFDNFPSMVRMTGAQLVTALELTTNGEHGIMQVSGLRYTFDEGPGAKGIDGSRLISLVDELNRPLDPARVYKVAMPNFLTSGGDGLLPLMAKIPAAQIVTDNARPVRDVLLDALQKRSRQSGTLEPHLDGRITVLHPKPANNRVD